MATAPSALPPLPMRPPLPTAPTIPTPAVGQPAGKAKVGGLGCPRCGGAIALPLGQRVVTCPYCHTPLLVAGEAGIERLAVRPRVTGEAARQQLSTWLGSGWHKDRSLTTEARLGEGFLFFLPFYRVAADVAGIALGTERRTRTVGSGKNRRTETYYVDVERNCEAHGERVLPAVVTAEWGLERVDLTGDEMVAFDREELERLGMVFPPTVSASEALAESLDSIRAEFDPGRMMTEVRFRFLETLRERLSLVYYPLWVIRWEHRQRSYQAVIDAEDGKLAYGKAPGNDTYRAAALVAAQAAAGFLATSALQWFDELEPMLFAWAAAAGLLFWGWRRFRWGGEVVEGTGLGKQQLSSLPAKLPVGVRRLIEATHVKRS